MAMRRSWSRWREALAPAVAGARGISTNRVLCVSGTKKGKIVEAAKKSGYKKGGRKPDKKKVESKNMKDSGAGLSIRVQVQSKPRFMEAVKISGDERVAMLGELTRLAKENSRILMREHKAKQWSESQMLRTKYAAIAAMPTRLRAIVKQPPWLPRRKIAPTLLPPIDGYPVEAAVTKKTAVFKKMR